MKRGCGVLMHISALPGAYSIGGFGPEAKRWIDLLAEAGFSCWQTLPFCLPDEYHSPYRSFSSFSGNPFFISPETLHKQGLLTDGELEGARQHTPYTCEFKRLEEDRMELLAKAAARLKDREAVEDYLAERPLVDRFCRFMALREKNGKRPWPEWTETEPDAEVLFLWRFTQYAFLTQWKEIRDYAHKKGVQIIGDIPIYVAYDSADVWGAPDQFDLDRRKRPRSVAGCPPDLFAKDGQMWGNPLYRWVKMRQDGFSFWRERLRHAFELFDGVRLDHFRGFSSFWSIPADAKTAKEGAWRRGPGRAFVDMVTEEAKGRPVIAEDLGEITPDVPKLLEYSGFPGMRVLQFGFMGDADSPHLPHNYPREAVAYTGTHDNDTLLGFIWAMDPAERARLFAYCGYEGRRWEDAIGAAIRALYASSAATVILPVQDLLRYGNDTRTNTPGTASGNWGYRVTEDQLATLDPSAWRRLAELYGRGRA